MINYFIPLYKTLLQSGGAIPFHLFVFQICNPPEYRHTHFILNITTPPTVAILLLVEHAPSDIPRALIISER